MRPRSRQLRFAQPILALVAGLLVSGCTAEEDIALCTRIADGVPLRTVTTFPSSPVTTSSGRPTQTSFGRSADQLDVALFLGAKDAELKGLVAAQDMPAAIARCREIGALD